jgi:hypothetical protein
MNVFSLVMIHASINYDDVSDPNDKLKVQMPSFPQIISSVFPHSKHPQLPDQLRQDATFCSLTLAIV